MSPFLNGAGEEGSCVEEILCAGGCVSSIGGEDVIIAMVLSSVAGSC